jgi:hypothetical protein
MFEVSLAGLGAVANDSIALFDNSNAMIGEAVVTQQDVLAGFVEVPLSGVFADGTHVISARLSDRAGNTGTRSVGLTVAIDTGSPSASPPVLSAASDSGVSSSDRITSVVRPIFSGTGVDGQRIDMYNGSGFLGSTTVTNGVWSYTALADLPDGSHQIRSKTVDLAGNESSFSSSVVVTIDTVRPADPTQARHCSLVLQKLTPLSLFALGQRHLLLLEPRLQACGQLRSLIRSLSQFLLLLQRQQTLRAI